MIVKLTTILSSSFVFSQTKLDCRNGSLCLVIICTLLVKSVISGEIKSSDFSMNEMMNLKERCYFEKVIKTKLEGVD